MKDAIAIAKSFAKVRKGVEKRKACKSCRRAGMKTLRISCASCRAEHAKALATAVKKLDALIAGKDTLPISATVKEYADSLR